PRTDRLFRRPVRRLESEMLEVGEDRAAVEDDVLGELSVLLVRELLRDELVEFPLELVQLVAEASRADALLVAQIAKLESPLENGLEVAGKADGSTTVRFGEATCPPDEVSIAKLMDGGFEAIVRRPAISAEEARVIGTENRFDDIETPARLDHVERGARAHEGPEPLGVPAGFPAPRVRLGGGTRWRGR